MWSMSGSPIMFVRSRKDKKMHSSTQKKCKIPYLYCMKTIASDFVPITESMRWLQFRLQNFVSVGDYSLV